MKIELDGRVRDGGGCHFMGQYRFDAFRLMYREKEKERERNIVITHFSAVYIFDSRFPEEEVDEIAMGEGMHEMWSWKKRQFVSVVRN